MGIKVIGMSPDPLGAPIDTLLEIASYNSDLYLAQKFDAVDASPFFPIGDFLRIKSRTSGAKRTLYGLYSKSTTSQTFRKSI